MRCLDARGAWSAASRASAYETTLRAISKMQVVHNEPADHEAARHLKLWVYGHIVGDAPRMGKLTDVRVPEAGISGVAAISRSVRGRFT
jgi:hypothetical protein